MKYRDYLNLFLSSGEGSGGGSGSGGDELLNSIIDRTVSGSITLNATSIGGYAFQSCASLTSVTLPAATSIENNAF